jgi:tRNA A-37 threonylcarbamoyl transferase component Bud32
MAHGDAASDDEATEELLPEDVATAAQSTHRRPKRPDSAPPQLDVKVSAFDDGVFPLAEHEIDELSPAPMSQPAQSAPATDPYLGKVIADRYLVERLLGVGSMGLVYRCRHTVLDKTVALKIIRQDLAQDEETVGRFMTEARSASAIGSKHIVEVLDFGALPDGASYIVMEYLEGLTLGEALDTPAGLSIGDALDIGIQMTEALGAAHAAGVVHRDLKPDNVFLLQSEGGWFVKILDFGIAKIMQSGQKLTVAGSVIGTPPPAMRSSAARTSSMLATRSVVSFARHLSTTASNPCGSVRPGGMRLRSGGGSSVTCIEITASGFSASNGTLPQASS